MFRKLDSRFNEPFHLFATRFGFTAPTSASPCASSRRLRSPTAAPSSGRWFLTLWPGFCGLARLDARLDDFAVRSPRLLLRRRREVTDARSRRWCAR